MYYIIKYKTKQKYFTFLGLKWKKNTYIVRYEDTYLDTLFG